MERLLKFEKVAAEKETRDGLKDRFRESALEGFHSKEVIELVLSYAVAPRDAKAVSASLIERFKGLRGVFDAAAEDLMRVEGMGEGAAILIRLLKELSGAYLKEKMKGNDVVRNPQRLLDYLKLSLSGERVEKFLAVYLNPSNEVIAVEVLHEGTINQTAVYPRKAIEKAFKHNAHAVIFVHNHPSGDSTPSGVDRQLTVTLERAASAVDLVVHDHIIIGRDRHFSAKESGWINLGPSRLIS